MNILFSFIYDPDNSEEEDEEDDEGDGGRSWDDFPLDAMLVGVFGLFLAQLALQQQLLPGGINKFM